MKPKSDGWNYQPYMTRIKSHDRGFVSKRTIVLGFGLAILVIGCDPADEHADGSVAEDPLELEEFEDIEELEVLPAEAMPVLESRKSHSDLEVTMGPLGYAWTGEWISEETPAGLCPPGTVNTGVACWDWYCNNMQLECNPAGWVGAGVWTSWFSEEGTSYRICDGNRYVTAMQCEGWWCDTLALHCSPTNTTPEAHQCAWSGWFSEEDSPFFAPYGTAIKGVQCGGVWCDSKRYYYCAI
jgi:hypothetical protein